MQGLDIKNSKILIVDDNPQNVALLEQTLEEEEFTCIRSTTDSKKALDIYKEFRPDLVLLDLNMPSPNGFQVMEQLQAEEKDSYIPVLVLTAQGSHENKLRALKAGARDFLGKPFEFTEILCRIRNLLEVRLLNNQINEHNRTLEEVVDKLTEIGTALSSEKNFTVLMETIISEGRTLTHADAGTLYLIEDDKLAFKIVQNDTLKIHLGGRSSKTIEFDPVEIEETNVSGYVAIKKTMVNIPDVYSSDLFNFTGPKKFDQANKYRSQSMMVVPLTNKAGETVGVLQLLNSKDPVTGEVVPFSAFSEKLIASLASVAGITVNNLLLEQKAEKLLNEVLDIKNYNENILESLSNGVISLDSNHAIVKCNAAALQILNVQPEQIINVSSKEYFSGKNGWIVDSINRMRNTDQIDLSINTEMFLQDESSVQVNLSAVPLKNTKKELIGSLLVLEDITLEKRLKDTLSRHLTKEVADRLLESGEEMLGGQVQRGSILFSDIRNFTAFTEKAGATETVAMLNEYFSVMVDVIFKYNGVLDKYIGDALLAVFGIPFGSDEDADSAVTTAIEMMRALKVFNLARSEQNKDPINIGIGISTDEVVAGNIGSPKRMEYTIIGDGVNLASRFEGATKFYGANILVSGNTLKSLKKAYLYREVDRLRVKGKQQSVKAYEILDFHDEESFPNLKKSIDLFHKGLKLYHQREWAKGLDYFEQCLSLNPKDALAKLYVFRGHGFLNDPPQVDWDGVWDMRSK